MKKMKKSLVTLGLLALGLAGCGNATPSDVASSEAPVSASAPVSTAVENEASIRFIGAPTTVERGNTITLRVSVTTDSDDMTAIFQSEQDGDIIELDASSTGVVSIKVTALAVGEATITAIASCNHKVKTSITINVISRLPSLQSAWKNIAKMKNYTLTSKNADDEIDRVVKVTENALVITEGADGAYAQYPMDENGEISSEGTSAGLAGLAIDANGYAYYLIQDGASFKAPGNIVKANVGLLNADNFTGLGTSADSWMEVDQSFYGLAVVNPSWLSSKKADNNVYDIEGSEDDIKSAYTEALLARLVASDLEEKWLVAENKTSFSAAEAAAAFDTSVKVLSTTEVEISVTYNSETVTATLSDIGSTEQDTSVTSFLTANATAEASAPELDTGMKTIQSAMLAGDYVENTTYTGYGSFTTYTTSNYIFTYYTDEFIAAYKSQTGKDLSSGGAFVTGTNGETLQGFTFTPAVTDDEGNVTTEASITLGQSASLISNGHTLPFSVAYGTFGSSLSFITDLVYTFQQYSSNGQTVYISYSKDVSDDLSERFFGDTLENVCSEYNYTVDSYTTAMTPTFDTTDPNNIKLTALNIEYGSFYENGAGPYAYNQKITAFGHATENDAHALLVANGLSDSVTLEDYLAGFAS